MSALLLRTPRHDASATEAGNGRPAGAPPKATTTGTRAGADAGARPQEKER